MQKDEQPHIPRAARDHGLFGKRFKDHFFVSKIWPPPSLTQEYQSMVQLMKKIHEFSQHENLYQTNRQKNIVRRMKTKCREYRNKIKHIKHGNSQAVKMLLQDHKEMQRLYMNMPTHLIIKNINQRTFNKRKERDRLRYRRDQLTKKYIAQMRQKHEIELRIKHQNEFALPEENEIKKCRQQLSNASTRMFAIRTISRTYYMIIQTLRKDAIYFKPILVSLQKDIDEQQRFINKVVNFGKPAVNKFIKLNADYQNFEKNVRKNLQERLDFFDEYQKKQNENAANMKKIGENAFNFNPLNRDRYNRDSKSMIDLRNQVQEVETVISKLKNTTMCSKAEFIHPMIERQDENIDFLEKLIGVKEEEHNLLDNKLHRSRVMKSTIKFTVTEEEKQKADRIAQLRKSLVDHRKEQQDIDNYIREKGEIIVQLRMSMTNIIDTLRHIGQTVHGSFRVYPDPDLKLPLLRFNNRENVNYPPPPSEEDVFELLHITEMKITKLMKAYREEQSKDELENAMDEYHLQYLQSLETKKDIFDHESEKSELFDVLLDRPDPNVPNYNQIKAKSAKIVEENLKKED